MSTNMNYIGKHYLAWCEPSGENAVKVYPRYLVNADNRYSPIGDGLPFDQCRITLIGDYGDRLRSEDFLESANTNLFKVAFTSAATPGADCYTSVYNESKGYSSWTNLIPMSNRFVPVVDIFENPKDLLEKRRTSRIDTLGQPSGEIVLHYADLYCGPFSYDTDEMGFVTLSGIERHNYKVGVMGKNKLVGKLISFDISTAVGRFRRFLPQDVVESFLSSPDQMDWISPEYLVKKFLEQMSEGSIPKQTIEQLRKNLTGVPRGQDSILLTDERVKKLDRLLLDYENHPDAVAGFVDSVLVDENHVKRILEVYIEHNPGRLEAIAKDQLHYAEVEAELKATIENLRQEVETLERGKKKAQEAVKKEQADALRQINEEIQKKQQQLAAVKKNLETAGKIGDLRKEADRLRTENLKAEEKLRLAQEKADKIESDLQSRTKGLEGLKTDITSMVESFRKTDIPSIADRLKTMVDEDLWKTLQGRGEVEAPSILPEFNRERLLENEEVPAFIERTKQFLLSAGRILESNDVVNYMTCLSQGFITTFAGEPGAGKTSLCNLLAKALGLSGDGPDRRFTEISVERGWTSHKDFVGYFNPLTKRIEKSNPEVFDAFELLSREDESKASAAPYVFLLDEANLSPMEHYWAAFLRICDFDSVQSRTLNLGGERPFQIPETVRFLATVNFDHTTEPLSPRFLNRSWVIMLNPAEIDPNSLLVSSLDNAEKTVPYEFLRKAFLPQKGDKPMSNEMEQVWSSIRDCFKEAQCSLVMPRSLKMVQNYCIVASKYMEDRLAPLDYAVAQKILPLVGGGGPRIKSLVENLRKKCVGLPRCKGLLDLMHQRAENDFYQFFSH